MSTAARRLTALWETSPGFRGSWPPSTAEEIVRGQPAPEQRAHLAAWSTHAQSLEPEVMMPKITRLTGEELKALVAGLGQLE